MAPAKVKIETSYSLNLFFSKYRVKLLIDGKPLSIIDRNSSVSYMIRLSRGSHTIRFEKEDDPSLFKEEVIQVQNVGLSLEYTLKTKRNEIEIKYFHSDYISEHKNCEIEFEKWDSGVSHHYYFDMDTNKYYYENKYHSRDQEGIFTGSFNGVISLHQENGDVDNYQYMVGKRGAYLYQGTRIDESNDQQYKHAWKRKE